MNCLPKSLICCPDELLSSYIELQLVLGKTVAIFEEIAKVKCISIQPGGTQWFLQKSPLLHQKKYR